MTIRRRIEEVDEDGRRTTTVVEEQPHAVEETVAEPVEDAEHERAPAEDARAGASSMVGMINLWVGVALTAVLALLAFRLGFLMAEANPNNGFVDFIYDITGPLVSPFQGIAEDQTVRGGGIFEPATAIAMGVYLVAAVLLMIVLGTIASGLRPYRGHH